MLYIILLCYSPRQVAGMADTGILPKFLGHRNSYGAPTFGVILSASGVICLGWLSFSEVIDMLNLLFCYGQAIEFFAFLHLRLYQPDMPRPFKIGVGFYGMCLMLSFPLLFILIIIYFSSRLALLISGTLAISGIFVYYMLEFYRSINACAFEDKEAIVWEYIHSTDATDHQNENNEEVNNSIFLR